MRAGGPELTLTGGVLDVAIIDRSELRTLGVVLALVVPLVGVAVTIAPAFVHDELFALVMVPIGTLLTLAGTFVGLGLALWNDGAVVAPRLP